MRSLIALLVVFIVAMGCSPSESPAEQAQANQPGTSPEAEGTANPGGPVSTNQPTGGGNQGGIAPVTTAPIPNAPVTGTESLQGSGSAVGTVAKDRAKQAAASAGGSTASQMGDGE